MFKDAYSVIKGEFYDEFVATQQSQGIINVPDLDAALQDENWSIILHEWAEARRVNWELDFLKDVITYQEAPSWEKAKQISRTYLLPGASKLINFYGKEDIIKYIRARGEKPPESPSTAQNWQ